MNLKTQLRFMFVSLILTSALTVSAKDQGPRKPSAICSVEAESVRTVSTQTKPFPAANNSMSEKLKKIQAVLLFDHTTVPVGGRFKLKSTDSVVMIQDRLEFGGRAINYATKESAQLFAITGLDPRTSAEYYTEIGQFEHSVGMPFVARYQHYLAIPEQNMNMALIVDERRQQNQLLGRRVRIILSAQDGQASASLNCVEASGERFSFAGTSRLK